MAAIIHIMPGQHAYGNMSAQQLRGLAEWRAMAERQLRNLGAAIQRAREDKGWSRARLAREIPVDPKTVERWEKGQTGGAMESLDNIARALGREPDTIIADSLPAPTESETPDLMEELSSDRLAALERSVAEILERQDQILAMIERRLLERAEAEDEALGSLPRQRPEEGAGGGGPSPLES